MNQTTQTAYQQAQPQRQVVEPVACEQVEQVFNQAVQATGLQQLNAAVDMENQNIARIKVNFDKDYFHIQSAIMRMRSLMDDLAAAYQNRQMAQENLQQARKRVLMQTVGAINPNWATETGFGHAVQRIADYYGFHPNEIESITDPRLLHMMSDALQFREMLETVQQFLNQGQRVEPSAIVAPADLQMQM